jgi:hypothetical protein
MLQKVHAFPPPPAPGADPGILKGGVHRLKKGGSNHLLGAICIGKFSQKRGGGPDPWICPCTPPHHLWVRAYKCLLANISVVHGLREQLQKFTLEGHY